MLLRALGSRWRFMAVAVAVVVLGYGISRNRDEMIGRVFILCDRIGGGWSFLAEKTAVFIPRW